MRLWLCSQPQDMRAGADRLLNIVVNTVGAARPPRLPVRQRCAPRASSCWCTTASACGAPRGGCTPGASSGSSAAGPKPLLHAATEQAAVRGPDVGLPWQRLGELSAITRPEALPLQTAVGSVDIASADGAPPHPDSCNMPHACSATTLTPPIDMAHWPHNCRRQAAR
jgi:transposase